MIVYIWKKFRDLSINNKTLIFSFASFFLIAIATYVDMANYLKMADKSSRIVDEVNVLSVVNQAEAAIINNSQANYDYVKDQTEENKTNYTYRNQEVNRVFDNFKNTISSYNGEFDYKINDLPIPIYLDSKSDLINSYYQRSIFTVSPEELARINTSLFESSGELLDGLQKLNIKISESKNYLLLEIENLKNTAIRRQVYLYLCVLAGMMFIRYLIHFTINKPLVNLERIIDLSNFKKRFKANDTTKDEIGKLGKSFNKLMKDLNRSYENLGKETDRLSAILNNIGDGVLVADEKFNVIVFNPAAEKITGFRAEEALGKNISEVLVFKDKGHLRTISNTLQRQGVCKPEDYCEIVQKSGRDIFVKGAATLFDLEENVKGAVFVLRDSTKEKEVNEMKSEFVSITSHQLNTPLTSVGWALETIISNKFGDLNSKQANLAKTAYKSNQQMRELVNDLLDVSRIETGKLKLKPEPIELNNYMSYIIETMKPIAKKKKQELVFEGQVNNLVLADTTYLRQAINNLISNASKYSPEEKQIEIKMYEKDGDIIISVKDEGIGIPHDEQKNLFQKFYRATNSSIAEGNGLGLYIIEEIMQHFRGKVWFESVEGAGSTFYLSLPIYKYGIGHIKEEKQKANTC